jgi:hypothetical protein
LVNAVPNRIAIIRMLTKHAMSTITKGYTAVAEIYTDLELDRMLLMALIEKKLLKGAQKIGRKWYVPTHYYAFLKEKGINNIHANIQLYNALKR